jgi:hypothetical protein
MSIDPQTTVNRVPKIAARLFEGRMLVITPEDGKLHRFNDTATFIWQLLEKPKKVEEICTAIVNNFSDIDQPGALKHTEDFVQDMLVKKLVTLAAAKSA